MKQTVHLSLVSLSLALLAMLAVLAGGARAAVEVDPSPGQRARLAIVIGNSTYQSARYEDLANAGNDARGLSESLKRLNFDVVTGIDLTAEGFQKILSDAEGRLDRYDAVVIFYAGHGVQLQGENYLLPTDTPDPDSLDRLTANAVKLNSIIARFASRDRQTFIFLDACRNNPLGSDGTLSDGLAQVEVGENTFIAFATQPGNVTVDGSGSNSPFTTALLKNVEVPGLSVSDMMIRVRNETEALTVGRQVPWDQSNLREQFYFTEQQEIDSATLSAALSRILSDPGMKDRLVVELASNDLQTAVLVVGEQFRSIGIPGGTGRTAGGNQQLASLSPALTGEGARNSVVSGLETLIVGRTPGEEGAAASPAIDIARSVQTELRRLGCYRMAVDGDWGKGSARALTDYYKSTKQSQTATGPSVELLSELFLRSGRVCRAPERVTQPAAARVATTSDSRSGGAKAGGRGPGRQNSAAPAARRPAPPPPDISAGIGIGGVF